MRARSFPRFLQRLGCAGLVIAGLAIGHAVAQAPPPPATPSEDAARRALS